ncbi:penicillin acylase family protein [Pseudoalteromonas sp. MMG013]|uniref:penicillin acylase family protein n=1 Tax=Pseudoalteromonas sp. MMG013 TaxID=2822687 RepID=UPI001B3964F1|nr:penicillin acylase family protein [Pseudoalteromonas sp. MMG013]MBQ4862204.1 penicillin acylase family protein [Pseudoalteromonas sp. MMG013]
MLNKHPMFLRLFLIVLLPIAMLFTFVWGYLQETLPEETGTLNVEGLNAQVKITRDDYGVPYIEATSDQDVFFSLGYIHAKERMWQLEMQKRMTQGRLSEVLGKEYLQRDIWFRTLGLSASAEKAIASLTPQAKASLDSYVSGINAWINSNPKLPAEFHILDVTPSLWVAKDSIAWIKLFALNLSGNFRKEISTLLAHQLLDDEMLKSIIPHVAKTELTLSKSSVNGLHDIAQLQTDIERDLRIGLEYSGSNAWVVGPQHTKGAHTILANDPHLGLQTPSLWFAASLKGDTLAATGMTLVGLPIIVFGKNNDIAWGGTAMMTDNQDLFIERPHHTNKSIYRFDEKWLEFTTRKETISVRADFPHHLRKPIKPVEIEVRESQNGPIISDIFRVSDQPIALKWTALEDQDTTYNAFFALNYATNWHEYKAALSDMISPNLNMFYADTSGNIGYLGVGAIPMRKGGESALPQPGWSNQHEWEGYVPAAEWPQIYNPEKGYIINANNKIDVPNYPYYISQDWAPPGRADRIEQLLKNKIVSSNGNLSFEDIAKMQADTINLPSRAILEYLKEFKPRNERQQQALDFMAKWNADMSSDSQAATIFIVWMELLRAEIFHDELANSWGNPTEENFLKGLANQVTLERLHHVLVSEQLTWCDDVSTNALENCHDMLSNALDGTLKRLSKLKGSDMGDWQWGHVNSASYGHFPLNESKFLELIFSRQIPNGGSSDSINVAISHFEQSKGYLQTLGASFRQIFMLNKANTEHYFMNSTGQSGNVISPHYDDMLLKFRDVEFTSFTHNTSPEKTLVLKAVNKQKQ